MTSQILHMPALAYDTLELMAKDLKTGTFPKGNNLDQEERDSIDRRLAETLKYTIAAQ